MRYEFHPDALDEYEDAARYYAGCQNGLELRFITCVESACRQVSEAPTRWRPFEQDVRRYPITCSVSPSCTVAGRPVIGVIASTEVSEEKDSIDRSRMRP